MSHLEVQPPQGRHVCLLTRQRIVGRTNGSSTYVLSICDHLKRSGFTLHYLSPSPATFGRWPWLRLGPELDVFATVRIRGGVKFGRTVMNTRWRAWFEAGLVAVEAILRRLGASVTLSRPAPYAIAAPVTEADKAFLRRRAGPALQGILVDYAFLTEAAAELRQPQAPVAVVMHDLFSSRGEQFARLASADSVAALSFEEEMRLLSRAGLVLAIQDEEAQIVRKALPGVGVALTPMAVSARALARPGLDDTLLFVGSKTAPNVDGLEWFLREVWPAVRAARPAARLRVAGSVCQSVRQPAPGVDYLGVVPDLAGEYETAGVVLSPLRAGSGLKIKLIEAMAEGKAIVATSVTLQGVDELVRPTVAAADTAEDFTSAIVGLCGDGERRRELGARALDVARSHFGPAACYGRLVDYFSAAPGTAGR